MKPPVSLEYVVVVALVALSAAALSYTTSQPAFSLAALLLGVYALHLVSVRVVVRQYAGTSPAKRSLRRGRAAGSDDEIRRIREALDLERRELENQKVELQQRIVAAEQQWELLRQMIRDRVEGGDRLPDSVIASSAGVSLDSTSTSVPRNNGGDEEPRIHGRW